MGATANGNGASFCKCWKGSKIDCGVGYNALNILKTIELYILNGWIVWDVWRLLKYESKVTLLFLEYRKPAGRIRCKEHIKIAVRK